MPTTPRIIQDGDIWVEIHLTGPDGLSGFQVVVKSYNQAAFSKFVPRKSWTDRRPLDRRIEDAVYWCRSKLAERRYLQNMASKWADFYTEALKVGWKK